MFEEVSLQRCLFVSLLLIVYCRAFIMPDFPEAEPKEERMLQLIIKYVITEMYLAGITKNKKRAVNRKADTLVINKGEVLFQCHWRKVKVVVEK